MLVQHGLASLGLARLFHRVEHDPDQHVEHDERRDQDEADEVDPRPGMDVHPLVHVVREVLERQHHEQRQHRAADVAPVLRDRVGEHQPADHPVDEEDRRGDSRHREERRHGPPDAEQEDPEVGQQAYDAHQACEPREPQERRVLADAGNEHRADHDEIEDVPAAAEEVPRPDPVGEDAEDELDDEDRRSRGR